jgi:hypothetical protein
MSWFKIDDGFHCHPKVFAAGTPAVGLYVRCGSWAAQQSTEGVVPRAVARQYGTPRMIKALVDAGLWHAADHDCDPCRNWHPEIPKDAFLIHEYLGYNPTKEATLAARAAKTDRQRRWREGRRQNDSDANSEGNSMRVDANSEGNSMRVGIELASSSGAHSEQIRDARAGNQQVNGANLSNVDASTRASRERGGDACPVPSRPVPSPVPPTEVQLASPDAPEQLPTIGPKPRIPANCRPLVDALTANRMAVGWNIPASDWLLIEALIKRCGIDMLVDHAGGQWQRARQRPQYGTYFIPGWRDLPDLVAASLQPVQAPTGPPTVNQRKRALFDDAAAKLAAGGFK